MKSIIVFILSLALLMPNIASANSCKGKFLNPITDVCWKCMFPISIGALSMGKMSGERDTKNPVSPVCACLDPVKVGITAGWWEPRRMVEIVYEPYCFPSLGGMTLPLGIKRGQGTLKKATSAKSSAFYSHYFVYPLLSILNIFSDLMCMETGEFDIAYVSELDPMGMDDNLSNIIHPEVFLFSNLLAQTACAADCIAATAYSAIDVLHWCLGCQGSLFPMNGNVSGHVGAVQATSGIAQRVVAKMHRLGLAKEHSAKTIEGVCHAKRSFIMKKSSKRIQMTHPSYSPCQAFGKTTILYESGKERPIVGENFAYLIFNKVNCCIG